MTATTYLHPDRIFDGHALRAGYVAVQNGTVSALLDTIPTGTAPQTLTGTLTPGYLDLQVNGGGDALVNTSPTAAAMQTIAAAHRRDDRTGRVAHAANCLSRG